MAHLSQAPRATTLRAPRARTEKHTRPRPGGIKRASADDCMIGIQAPGFPLLSVACYRVKHSLPFRKSRFVPPELPGRVARYRPCRARVLICDLDHRPPGTLTRRCWNKPPLHGAVRMPRPPPCRVLLPAISTITAACSSCATITLFATRCTCSPRAPIIACETVSAAATAESVPQASVFTVLVRTNLLPSTPRCFSPFPPTRCEVTKHSPDSACRLNLNLDNIRWIGKSCSPSCTRASRGPCADVAASGLYRWRYESESR